MDHSQMADMDHADMPGMSGSQRSEPGEAPEMDHSRMPGMNQAAPRENMQAMDHSRMGTMQDRTEPAAQDSGTDKLRTLVAELVRDPVVQQRIQADTALRRLWDEEGVRRVLLDQP